ncbi:hypothetical protein M407DRAFT_193980 [Tulasnella calospora MUT 4182]|uniref:Uncharacterized protein n=1 Tax=Tulasnella calospora MUT 4182 TaxID=1051891 RepID=A0A0C3M0L4_9AGAM|nr:hypothetical protein M407DRAFT_193980 [Tulasnella calospora MUT 4182]
MARNQRRMHRRRSRNDPHRVLQVHNVHICVIVQPSFSKEKFARGFMFRKGVCTSGTSFRSHGYIKQVAPPRYRAMLMRHVLVTKAKKLTRADHNLVAAPAGFNSLMSTSEVFPVEVSTTTSLSSAIIVKFDRCTLSLMVVLELPAISVLFHPLDSKLTGVKTAPIRIFSHLFLPLIRRLHVVRMYLYRLSYMNCSPPFSVWRPPKVQPPTKVHNRQFVHYKPSVPGQNRTNHLIDL